MILKKGGQVKIISGKDKGKTGEILEIKNDKALINGSVNKDGKWCDKKKWVKLKDIVLSVDYEKYHKIRDDVDKKLHPIAIWSLEAHLHKLFDDGIATFDSKSKTWSSN